MTQNWFVEKIVSKDLFVIDLIPKCKKKKNLYGKI